MPPRPRTWDDYFIPGTDTLRNLLGKTTRRSLERTENMHTARRIGQLIANPISGAFDYEHMKSIHRYIFQDVYEWAGEERTTPQTAQ